MLRNGTADNARGESATKDVVGIEERIGDGWIDGYIVDGGSAGSRNRSTQ